MIEDFDQFRLGMRFDIIQSMREECVDWDRRWWRWWISNNGVTRILLAYLEAD